MKVGILGTGSVGRELASAIARQGHAVVMGTRDVAALAGRQVGDEPFPTWCERHSVETGSFAAAAAHGELVFNATSGAASLDALRDAGAQNLAGKILVDVANPLDFSGGMPPRLTVANDDSLGEQIQRTFPDTRVVKALNTVNAAVMVDPARLGDGAHDMFVCGDDAEAKVAVTVILRDWFGWNRVLDLGDITGARGMEMYLPLWVRMMQTFGTPLFNLRVVGSA